MFEPAEIALVFVCLVVSLLNASVGTTGGVTFAAMASVLPASAVVPIHGLVEGTASGFRWLMLRQFVDYRFVWPFVLGGLLGFAVGLPLIGWFSVPALQILLGAFILLVAWMPIGRLKLGACVSGIITSALTLLVGATGPLVAAILTHHQSDQRWLIGTQGAATAYQHGVKALLFGLWGFSFAPFIPLILLLIAAIVLGTWLGKRILLNAPQHLLRVLLKIIVTVLGLRLVWTGISALL